MASSTFPTILLIPGAFTTPACYDSVLPYLHKEGFETVVASLSTTNSADPEACNAETEGAWLVQQYVQPLLDAQKDVVVYAHSFGATALGTSGNSLVKSERETRGLKGGIAGIVYMTFVAVPAGESQLALLGGTWPPFCKLDSPKKGLMIFDPIIETLYNDLPASMHEQLVNDHLPQAMTSFSTPVLRPLWADSALAGRRIWLKTSLDATIPAEAQQMFADNSGVEWEMREIEAGHSAFLSQPEKVAEVVVQAARKWS